MYAAVNVKKFLYDKRMTLGHELQEMLNHLRRISVNGMVDNDDIEIILKSRKLADEFREAVLTDSDHMRLAEVHMRRALH